METDALNSTSVLSEPQNSNYIYFALILAQNCLIIFSICLNISVIVITYVGKCMEQNPNSIYVLCLAVADFLKGVFFFTHGVILEYSLSATGGKVPFIMCVLLRALLHMASLFSGYTLLLTSFVQYFAVAHPHFHKKWMGVKFSRLAIVIGWTLCVVQTICVFFSLVTPGAMEALECTDYNMFGENIFVNQILEILGFWLSLVVLIVLNGKLITAIIRIGNNVAPLSSQPTNTTAPLSSDRNNTPCFIAVMEMTSPNTESSPMDTPFDSPQIFRPKMYNNNTQPNQTCGNKHWKPFITLIVLVVSFAVSLGPYAVYFTVELLSSPETLRPPGRTVRILGLGIVVNTVTNPLIYAFRIPVYRRFIENNILKTRL